MENKPIVSIIIPCYNDADYIEQAVHSALDQTYPYKEVIVVDDGSNIQSKKVLKKIENKIDLLITQENKGTGAARNSGINAAQGDFILVLDSDDYFEPEFCEKAIAVFKKRNNVKMVTCHARWFSSTPTALIFKPRGGSLKNYLCYSSGMGSSMFLKEDWKEAGGYDETMIGFEDWEFYIRLHKNGGETFVIPEVLFHYRNKVDSRNSSANQRKYELMRYIYLKHNNLYKENFELFVEHLIFLLKQEAKEKAKNTQSIDFKIGKTILKPIRYLKTLIR